MRRPAGSAGKKHLSRRLPPSDALTASGDKPVACGWIKDRYGVPWQIVPRVLLQLLADSDPARAARVMQAMLGMVKLDIAGLEKAHAG